MQSPPSRASTAQARQAAWASPNSPHARDVLRTQRRQPVWGQTMAFACHHQVFHRISSLSVQHEAAMESLGLYECVRTRKRMTKIAHGLRDSVTELFLCRYMERDPVRGKDSFAAFEEMLLLAKQKKVRLGCLVYVLVFLGVRGCYLCLGSGAARDFRRRNANLLLAGVCRKISSDKRQCLEVK